MSKLETTCVWLNFFPKLVFGPISSPNLCLVKKNSLTKPLFFLGYLAQFRQIWPFFHQIWSYFCQIWSFSCSFWWLEATYSRDWSSAFEAKEQTTFCQGSCSDRHAMGCSQKSSIVCRSQSVQLPHGFLISRGWITSAPAPISSASLFASRFAAWPISLAASARRCFGCIFSLL